MLGITPDDIALILTLASAVGFLVGVTALALWFDEIGVKAHANCHRTRLQPIYDQSGDEWPRPRRCTWSDA